MSRPKSSRRRPSGPPEIKHGWNDRTELLIALAMGVGMTREQATREIRDLDEPGRPALGADPGVG